MTSSAPGGEARLAVTAGIACYLIWGVVPLAFQLLGRMGVGPWEILANRSLWAAPTALGFVLLAGQGAQVRSALRNPATLRWLALSSLLIAANWVIFIGAVNSGRVLETSLGYYINPLFSMAAGAAIFRERIDRIGVAAIALAAIGVTLQAIALGHIPLVSLALAVSFCGYGVVRKHVAADAQSALLIECLFLAAPGLAYLLWLRQTGAGHLGTGVEATAWLVACGPITAVPLLLFGWAARRAPLSAMGFMQFIAPTMTFFMGVFEGEPLTPARAASFLFIWSGAAVFAFGAWRRTHALTRVREAAAATAAE